MYTDTLRSDRLAVITSTDGGATWSLPVGIPVTDAVGAFPVIRQSGELVVVYLWNGRRLGSSVSVDGALSFGPPAVIAELQAHDVSRPGETISLDLNLRRATLFDARTERAL